MLIVSEAMSGHSKWSTIKRQKGAADIKRGQTFTKISNAITIAVKQGGGIADPAENPKLRLAVEAARSANMPKENIERAIARAKTKGEGELTEVTYEGFAPGGVSVLVEATSDNVNRTTSEVKGIFNKAGAGFGRPGSTSYLFRQVGEIAVVKNEKSIEDIFLIAEDIGAKDIEDRADEVVIYVDPPELFTVSENLKSSGLAIIRAELSRKPITTIDVSSDLKEKIINFLSSLEEIDDVQKVYSNILLN